MAPQGLQELDVELVPVVAASKQLSSWGSNSLCLRRGHGTHGGTDGAVVWISPAGSVFPAGAGDGVTSSGRGSESGCLVSVVSANTSVSGAATGADLCR